jgi:hypothetical protein
MKPKLNSPLMSKVAGRAVHLPIGTALAEGTEVLIVPVEWLRQSAAEAPQSASKTRHRFASEDLIGCYEGIGRSATNAEVKARLSKKRQQG